MSQIFLRLLRKWMVFITTFNFLGMIAFYGYMGINDEITLLWEDWAIIISAIGFFIFYILSLRGSGFQNVHKYLRTFLLLVPTIVVLYITCYAIHMELLRYNKQKEFGYVYWTPFTCGGIQDYICNLVYTNLFAGLITALFVVIEIGVTLAWGPLEKAQAHRFGGAQGGYTQNANVILVSPDQPYQQQQEYYYPQQQQQLQQQQGYYPHLQQLQHPPQQPILIGPNVTQQQQLLQQQGPDSPSAHLPYTPSAHTQSPIAATATSGYQPSPQPSQPSTSENHKPSSPHKHQ